MSKRAFDKITAGLEGAIAITRGEAAPRAYRVHVAAEVDVKATRRKLGVTQAEFAAAFGFALDAVQDWEQGRRRPEGAARAFLKVHRPRTRSRPPRARGVRGLTPIRAVPFDPTADNDYDARIGRMAAGIVGIGAARMASITIRNVAHPVKAQQRVRAARHGRSMEDEARQILRHALSDTSPLDSLDALFRKGPPARGKFLSRLFGIFSETIVQVWSEDERAPYKNHGRPRLAAREVANGGIRAKSPTLDFLFECRRSQIPG
jgi:putative transcriptional regulator